METTSTGTIGDPLNPRAGIREWTNPSNRLHIVQIHYTADLDKRDPAWAAAERPKHLPRAWAREYEIAWTVPEGEPVVPEYDAKIHERRLAFAKGVRLLRFWDFGYVSPVVLLAQLLQSGQLRFLREICPFNTPLPPLIEMAKATAIDLAGPIEAAKAFDCGDPEVNSQTDLGSIAETLSAAGIHCHSTRPGTEVSYAQFRTRFTSRLYVPGIGHEPAVLVDPIGCPNLAEALRGSFHLSPIPPYRPVRVHPWVDLVDAARYGSDNLSTIGRDYNASLRQMATADVDPRWPSPSTPSIAFGRR